MIHLGKMLEVIRMLSYGADLGWSFCIFTFVAGHQGGTRSTFDFEADDTSGICEQEAWRGIEMSACSIRIVT